jgi:hypothetical protein
MRVRTSGDDVRGHRRPAHTKPPASGPASTAGECPDRCGRHGRRRTSSGFDAQTCRRTRCGSGSGRWWAPVAPALRRALHSRGRPPRGSQRSCGGRSWGQSQRVADPGLDGLVVAVQATAFTRATWRALAAEGVGERGPHDLRWVGGGPRRGRGEGQRPGRRRAQRPGRAANHGLHHRSATHGSSVSSGFGGWSVSTVIGAPLPSGRAGPVRPCPWVSWWHDRALPGDRGSGELTGTGSVTPPRNAADGTAATRTPENGRVA